VSESEKTLEANQNKAGILSCLWDAFEMGIPFICMLGALVLCFTQVIVRYVFFYSISWSEEIAKWFVIWVTFAGSAYAFKMGTHIGVEAFVNMLPAKPRKVVN